MYIYLPSVRIQILDVFYSSFRHFDIGWILLGPRWRPRPLRIPQVHPPRHHNSQKGGKSTPKIKRHARYTLIITLDRLPQWEGVGRKWYYVQRTTGKSQWEIPTEPVVLTPSTTPTPMGAGPTQEPRSHPTSNSTRELESVDITAGGTYSAADSARISVGNRAHYVCVSFARMALMVG